MLSIRRRRGSVSQPNEMLIETRAQRSVVGGCGAGLRENYEVPRRQLALESECFAREALESVAIHGAFRGSARNGQAEARDRATRGPGEYGEETIGRSGGLCKHATELGRVVQTLLGCEPFPARQQIRAKTRSATA
jgi:hypothetical protein